jgi:uncharacterized protein (TIGR00297 family)
VAVHGGIFGLSALLSLAAPWAGWSAIAAGSLGAAMADTWSTEIGTLVGGTPHLITTGRVVPAGTSGAITLPGSLGAVAGAAVLALVARAVGWSSKIALAAFVAGIAGALADTLIGALIQSRRWCDACSSATEQRVHHCGTATRHHGGLAWLDNDGVNLACAAVGGVVAWMIHA